MDAALRRNADFASKPCVLQHFGSPPFNSITSKYCKGYKFHKKEDFKMLKNRGVVPGPVTLFLVPLKSGRWHIILQLAVYMVQRRPPPPLWMGHGPPRPCGCGSDAADFLWFLVPPPPPPPWSPPPVVWVMGAWWWW